MPADRLQQDQPHLDLGAAIVFTFLEFCQGRKWHDIEPSQNFF
jgi:hypothetical protein